MRTEVQRRRPGAALVLTLAALAIALPVCRSKTSAGSGGASITVTSPTDGSSVTSPVKLELSVTGATIGPPSSGNMHFHIHIDGSSEYSVLTSTTGEVQLPTGKHTIEVVLAQPNHDETNATATATVNVTSSGGATATPTGGGYGGGY